MQAPAANVVTNVVPTGTPSAAPDTNKVAGGGVFAKVLAALDHQFADKGAPELLSADNLTLADTTPSPNADPSAAGTLGVNLQALLAALHSGAAKPTKSTADATKILDESAADSTDAPSAPAAASATSPPADPGTLLAQLLGAVPQAQSAAAEPLPADTRAPADAPINEIAAEIVPNATTTRSTRAGGTKEPSTATDNTEAHDQSATENALAALSAASGRNFLDQPGTPAAPVHGGGERPADNHAAGNGQADNAHSQNPPAANDARPDALSTPAPQAAVAANNTQANAPTPSSDGATLAATNGVAANSPPSAVNAHLQVTHTNPLSVPDTSALAVAIATRSQAGARHFDIRLDPPELGRVDVRLTLNDAGEAQAALTVERPQTLELLQKDSSNLERALKDAGLDLSQNGLNFSLKGQQQNGNEHSPAMRGRALSVQAIVTDEPPASTLSLSSVGASQTRLDIRV